MIYYGYVQQILFHFHHKQTCNSQGVKWQIWTKGSCNISEVSKFSCMIYILTITTFSRIFIICIQTATHIYIETVINLALSLHVNDHGKRITLLIWKYCHLWLVACLTNINFQGSQLYNWVAGKQNHLSKHISKDNMSNCSCLWNAIVMP